MKPYPARIVVAFFLSASLQISLSAAVEFWDPDGATPGTSISGNWDTITPNWTATPDSGVNTVWSQGSDAAFGIAANYAVTLTEPITFGNITVSGSAGTLTLSGTTANSLTLAGSSTLNTGGRNITISAPINGSFDLTRVGGGTLTLSGASTYSGGTTLSAGTASLGVDSAYSGSIVSGPFGTGPVNITINTASTTVTISPSGARVLDNPIVLNTNLTISGSAPLYFRTGGWQLNVTNRTVTVNNSADTILQNLADDGVAHTVTKAGTGRVIMIAGTNSSYLGGMTVSGGAFVAGNETPFPTNNNNQVTVNGPGVLDLNGFNVRVSRLGGNATGSVLLGTNTLTAGSAGSAEFSGVISGTGGYVKVGSVSEVLSGTNTFSGGITIMESALYLPTNAITGSPIALGAGTNTITIMGTGRIGANRNSPSISIVTNNVILANTGPTAGLDPANGGLFVLAGTISGSGGILRYSQGSGTATLSGDNTFTGGVEVDARTLGIGHPHALGTGPFIIGNPTIGPSQGIVIATATDLSGPNAITNTTSLNQSFTISATNDFEISGSMTMPNPSTLTITVLGTNSVTLSGNIDGIGGFLKTGDNTLILSGSNTFSGGGAIGTGTLLVNNLTGSGTGSGSLQVASGATLGGSGTIAGPVTIFPGGFMSAGNTNAGKLTLAGGLDLSSGGDNIWELTALKDDATGAAGVDFDQLAVTGGTLALGGSSLLSLSFTNGVSFPDSTNAFWQANHTWKIVSVSDSGSNPGNSNFSAIDRTNGISAGTFSTSVDGAGSIILSYASATAPAPVIDSRIPGAGTTNAMISWSSVSGQTYQVQFKTNLLDPNWNILGSVTATGSNASISDNTSPVPAQRFYRIVIP